MTWPKPDLCLFMYAGSLCSSPSCLAIMMPSTNSDLNKVFNDSPNTHVTGGVVLAVVGLVGILMIVVTVVILSCIKKNGMPLIHFSSSGGTPRPFVTLEDSHIKMATVEKFLNELAREKPIRFSPQQLAGFTHRYTTRLGSGGFGAVYKGELPNGVLIAVKVLNGEPDKSVEEQFMAEMGTIGRTYHANLVRLYGFCYDATVRAVVYEFMEKGSLDRYLFDKGYPLEWRTRREIAIGTAKAIRYLHEECQQKIIHYDIKPGNILLDSSLAPKVADFGLAKLCSMENTQASLSGGRGTPGYAAPEVWMPFPVTNKCDVYSFGMLLFEIVSRRHNFIDGLSESREWLPKWVWDKFEKGEVDDVVSVCDVGEEDREKAKRLCKVALWCVQYQPEARPAMSQVVMMLEGDMEIDFPGNPFRHLISSAAPSVPSSQAVSNSTGAS